MPSLPPLAMPPLGGGAQTPREQSPAGTIGQMMLQQVQQQLPSSRYG